jgi:hypothetical protein
MVSRLAATIDQAEAVISEISTNDVDGQTRPMGSAGDIGADEYPGESAEDGSGDDNSDTGTRPQGVTQGSSRGTGCFINMVRRQLPR